MRGFTSLIVMGAVLLLGACQQAGVAPLPYVPPTPTPAVVTVCGADQVPRCLAVIDASPNGGANLITLDNASSLPNDGAVQLLMTADRSTQNADLRTGPFRKGLMKDGDRVYVGLNYMAWFDCAVGPCSLAGLWALDPTTGTFRHQPVRNQIIRGSASPNGEPLWWDQGPTIEHTFSLPKPGVSVVRAPEDLQLFSTMNARKNSTANWKIVDDGRRDANGVYYSTSSLMVDWQGPLYAVSTVKSSVEYVCRSDDILMTWTFSPTTEDLSVTNIYVAFWLAYADNEDDTSCDVGGPGQQWPHTFSDLPLFVASSEVLEDNWTSPFTLHAPRSITKLFLQQPPCHRNNSGVYPNYYNPQISMAQGVPAGSWILIGVDPGLSPRSPLFQVTMVDQPGAGEGTVDHPINLNWRDCNAANENVDGTVILECVTQSPPAQISVFTKGKVYQSRMIISTAR